MLQFYDAISHRFGGLEILRHVGKINVYPSHIAHCTSWKIQVVYLIRTKVRFSKISNEQKHPTSDSTRDIANVQNGLCLVFDLQLWPLACKRLLNKPYVRSHSKTTWTYFYHFFTTHQPLVDIHGHFPYHLPFVHVDMSENNHLPSGWKMVKNSFSCSKKKARALPYLTFRK